MNIIATDGGGLPSPVTVDELLLLPGERVDVLIQGTEANGSYRLLSLPYQRCHMQDGMMMDGCMGGGMNRMPPPQTDALVLATMTLRQSLASLHISLK